MIVQLTIEVKVSPTVSYVSSSSMSKLLFVRVVPETVAVYRLFACIVINKMQSNMCAKLFSKKAQVEICIVLLTVEAFC